MNKLLAVIILFISISCSCSGQGWTNEQLRSANTAYNINYISQVEKDAIMYINLARIYPKYFLSYEVNGYKVPEGMSDYLKGSPYLASLKTLLASMPAKKPLFFDRQMYEYAKCFAKESGEKGLRGHDRVDCADGNFAECCSYGMSTAKDIVMQWLIDHGVPGVGHRTNCLNDEYSKIGLSVHAHKTAGTCAVADIIWADKNSSDGTGTEGNTNNRDNSTNRDNSNNTGNSRNTRRDQSDATTGTRNTTNNAASTFSIDKIIDNQGAKPVLRLVLDAYSPGRFYVFFPGTIYYFDEGKNLLTYLSKKDAPYFKEWNALNWSWSFSIKNATGALEKYSVATNGDIYVSNANGKLVKAGVATAALE